MSFSINSFSRVLVGLSCVLVIGACGKKTSSSPEPVAPPPTLVTPAAPTATTPPKTVTPPVAAPTLTLAPATVIKDADLLQKSPSASTVNFGFSGAPAGLTSSGVSYECKLDAETDFAACNGGDSYTFANLQDGTSHTLKVRGTITATKTLLTEASVTFTAHLAAAGNDTGTGGNDTTTDTTTDTTAAGNGNGTGGDVNGNGTDSSGNATAAGDGSNNGADNNSGGNNGTSNNGGGFGGGNGGGFGGGNGGGFGGGNGGGFGGGNGGVLRGPRGHGGGCR